MQLSQAKLLGIEDHHEGRLGYIHPDLDDGRGHQERGTTGGKVLHDLRLERGRSAPRQLMNGNARKRGVGTQVGGDLLDRC